MKRLEVSIQEIMKFGELARKASFFTQLTVGQMDKMLDFVMLYEYRKGEKICSQGGPGDSFYLIRGGRLGVSVKKGFFSLSKRVAELGPGDFFGETALLEQSPRTATVRALEDSTAFVLLAQHFMEVAKTSPEFMEYIRSLSAVRKFEREHGK